jgi:hypothetical protein
MAASYDNNTDRFKYSTPGTLMGRINQFLPSPMPTREEHCKDAYVPPNVDGMVEIQNYECLEAGKEYWITGVFSAMIDGVPHNVAGRAEGAFISLVNYDTAILQYPSKIRFRIHRFFASPTPKTLPRIKNSPESPAAIEGGESLRGALKELVLNVAPNMDSMEVQMNRILGSDAPGVNNFRIAPGDPYKSVPYNYYAGLYNSNNPARFHVSNANQYEYLLLDTIPHLLKSYIYLPAKDGSTTAKQTERQASEKATAAIIQDEKNLEMLVSAIINNNIGDHNDSYGTWRDVSDPPPTKGGRKGKKTANKRRKSANRRRKSIQTRSRTRRVRRP